MVTTAEPLIEVEFSELILSDIPLKIAIRTTAGVIVYLILFPRAYV